jgi:hypothetical protein
MWCLGARLVTRDRALGMAVAFPSPVLGLRFGPTGLWYLAAMGFRFSIKWMLGATLYVAFVVAAFAQIGWWWADFLWLMSFLAMCYATASAIFAEGKQRAAPVGFLLGSSGMLAAIQFAPMGTPINRIIYLLSTAQPLLFTDPYTGAVNLVHVRAANAIAVMVAGIAGSWLAVLAYRKYRPAPPHES